MIYLKKSKITKRQAIRRRRIFKFLIFLIVVFSIYLIIFETSLFDIKEIKVLDNNKTKTEDIRKQSGFKEGYNIFDFKKKLGEERISKLPYIKTVDIRRKLPNKLIIRVTERESVACVRYLDSYVYMDGEGRILYIGNKLYKQKKPEFFGLKLSNLKEGENIFTDKQVFELSLLNMIEKYRLEEKIKYINLYDMDNIVFQLSKDEKVYLGQADDLAYKINFIEEILKDAEKKEIKIKSIDFTKGTNPVVITQ